MTFIVFYNAFKESLKLLLICAYDKILSFSLEQARPKLIQ